MSKSKWFFLDDPTLGTSPAESEGAGYPRGSCDYLDAGEKAYSVRSRPFHMIIDNEEALQKKKKLVKLDPMLA